MTRRAAQRPARAEGGGRIRIEIRDETLADLPAIREVNERAFGRLAEAQLVDMLRAADKVVVSLVAVRGERAWRR